MWCSPAAAVLGRWHYGSYGDPDWLPLADPSNSNQCLADGMECASSGGNSNSKLLR
jgi:hypothetical protein